MATSYYRPLTGEPLKDDELPSHGVELPTLGAELPSHDALAHILPDYQYIFIDPQAKDKNKEYVSQPSMAAENPLASATLLDHYMKELGNYRTAVNKMSHDLLSLREKLVESESSNSQLRTQLAHYDDTTRLLLDSSELDGLTKPELATRYASLKLKLTSQTAEMKTYKDKVCYLQNEIIRKNDEAKDFLSIRNAHNTQQSTLHKLQEKVKKLKKVEDTCQKQEKVIEKLEALLKKKKSVSNGFSNDAQDALLLENKRLRDEISYHQEQSKLSDSNEEKNDLKLLELHEALEKADGRIMALEKQIDVNARQWGRERADLMLKLQETKRGFKPTVGISDLQTGRFLEEYKPDYLKQKKRNSRK